MALKLESEREKAHRVFKYYKSTNKFPPDISTLDSYKLLSKYNYFIAKDVDKVLINTLTQICNLIEKERVLLVYGDFTLESLYFGLNSFSNNEFDGITINYIDSNDHNIIERIPFNSSSHFNNFIFYVIDNVENLSAEEVKFICFAKQEITDSNKAIICCALDTTKVNKLILNNIKKVKLGTLVNNKISIQTYVYNLLNEKDRNKAYNLLKDIPNASFLFSIVTYNIPHFFKDNAIIRHNIMIMEKANSMLYKVSSDLLWKFVVNSLFTTKTKMVVRFPPKLDDSNSLTKGKQDEFKKIPKTSSNKKSTKKTENKKQLKKDSKIRGVFNY